MKANVSSFFFIVLGLIVLAFLFGLIGLKDFAIYVFVASVFFIFTWVYEFDGSVSQVEKAKTVLLDAHGVTHERDWKLRGELKNLRQYKIHVVDEHSEQMFESGFEKYPIVFLLENPGFVPVRNIVVESFSEFSFVNGRRNFPFDLSPGERVTMVVECFLEKKQEAINTQSVYNKGYKEGIHDVVFSYEAENGDKYRMKFGVLLLELKKVGDPNATRYRTDILSKSVERV